MTTTDSMTPKTAPAGAGDAAVGGLLHGLVAGLAMGAYLALAGLVQGIGPVALWSRFAGAFANPVAGIVGHLAVSAVYGTVWGLLWWPLQRRFPRLPGWLAGLAYGLVLLLIAQGAALTLNPLLLEIGLVHRTLAHLIYGLALGLQADRRV